MVSLPQHLRPPPARRDPLPAEVRREHQRDRVVGVAIEVFAKRGYPATTVDHIVAAAKVGIGSFYALFDGKQDCFLAVLDNILASGREQVEVAVPTSASQAEKVCAGLRALLGLIEAEPLRARVALVEAQTAGKVALERYEATLEGIVPALRRCREESPFAEELPETLEVATLGGALWFLQQRIALGETSNATELLPEVAEIVLEPYIGRDGTERLVAAATAA